MGNIKYFSYSEASNSHCSNKHYILNRLRLRSRKYSRIKAMYQGRLFHAGIEIMYKLANQKEVSFEDMTGGLLAKVLDHVGVLADRFAAQVRADDFEQFEANTKLRAIFERKMKIDFGVIQAMLEAYYNEMFLKESFEVVSPEQRFELPIVVPPDASKQPNTRTYSSNKRFVGYIDAIIRNVSGDGSLYIHEVKTAANWGTANEMYLAVDDQTAAYVWAARELGFNVKGIIYTVCQKPGMKLRLSNEAKKAAREWRKTHDGTYQYDDLDDYEPAEDYLARVREDYVANPEKYLIRKVFTRDDADLAAFERRIYWKGDKLIKMQKRPPFPEANPMVCPKCQAFELCKNFTEETKKKWYIPKERDRYDLDEMFDLGDD